MYYETISRTIKDYFIMNCETERREVVNKLLRKFWS